MLKEIVLSYGPQKKIRFWKNAFDKQFPLSSQLEAWWSFRCPCPSQGSWTRWFLRILFNSNHSTVLWLYHWSSSITSPKQKQQKWVQLMGTCYWSLRFQVGKSSAGRQNQGHGAAPCSCRAPAAQDWCKHTKQCSTAIAPALASAMEQHSNVTTSKSCPGGELSDPVSLFCIISHF